MTLGFWVGKGNEPGNGGLSATPLVAKISQPFDGLTLSEASDIVEFLYSSTISPTLKDKREG
jgi:hypothetical protein